MLVELDPQSWALQQFGPCQLGDSRRTARVVKMAARFAERPDGGTAAQTENWGDLKAAYRLFDNEAITFEQLIQPHCQATKQAARGVVLIANDTTECDFRRRTIEGLGPTGNGFGRGFFLHSALMMRREDGEVLGMAAQKLFHRKPRPKGENSTQKLQRPRESQVWGEVVELVGPSPAEAYFIHVCDRGADNFEFYCWLRESRCGWVVRAAHAGRWALTADDQLRRVRLGALLAELPVLGEYDLLVDGQKGAPSRTARIQLRATRVHIPRPRHVSPWVKKHGPEGIEMSTVEVREIHAPKGVTPLLWMLLSSEPCGDIAAARQIAADYEKRPVVEDYHKGLKTGCRLESRQYMTSARLERVVGLLSIVAVRLLQLRAAARETPQRLAHEFVPPDWLTVLCDIRYKPTKSKLPPLTPETVTAREFYREIAKLGGFLGRKSDGEPGWQTLWRGFEKLHLFLRGFQAKKETCG